MTDQSTLPHREIIVHFDGSCLNNPGPGGWAAHIENVATGKRCTLSGSARDETTNNRMEVTAAIEALQFIREGANVTMVGDSRYVIDGATKWLQAWKARGWRKSGGGAVVNVDLWEQMEPAMQRPAKITWTWQRGHVGHRLNDLVDGLAKTEAERRQRCPSKPDRKVRTDLPGRQEREAVAS
jgi:ribonuclease HI